MKFKYGKIFLLGFGFFGVSVIWSVYNAFVPLFLANKFHFAPWLIGLFMTFDNIAALFIQPPVGAWSDRLRTKIGRRMPFILIGAPVGAIAFGLIPIAGCPGTFCGLHQHASAQHGFLANAGGRLDARHHPIAIPIASEWDHQPDGRGRNDHCIAGGKHPVRNQRKLPLLDGVGAGHPGSTAGFHLH